MCLEVGAAFRYKSVVARHAEFKIDGVNVAARMPDSQDAVHLYDVELAKRLVPAG